MGVFGHLATITSAEENAFIQSAFNDGLRHSAWIGLTDDEAYGGQESGGPSNPGAPYWVWVTGEPVAYTNWIAGAPNNQLHIPEGEDYTEFVFENQGEWNDLPDFQPHLRDFYLIEYDVPLGDANGDGCVSGADYTIWADNYDDGTGPGGKTWRQGDWSGEGYVSGADYTIWADHFGEGCSPSPVPEPLSLDLLVLGAVAMLARRNRPCAT